MPVLQGRGPGALEPTMTLPPLPLGTATIHLVHAGPEHRCPSLVPQDCSSYHVTGRNMGTWKGVYFLA